MSFSIEDIRQQFPAIIDNPHCLHYLDSAATAQKPQSVIDRLTQFYQRENAAVHRGIHQLSSNATIAMEQARASVSDFINAQSPKEIVFTKGTTESINLVANSWGKSALNYKDEIIISEMEHHANIVPWQIIAQTLGVIIKVWPVNEYGELSLEVLATLISDKTKLITLTHVSNVLGTVNPVAEVCQLAQKHNIKTLIDGAQAVVHQAVDVEKIGCDFYVFSGHKLYGPTGIGVLWAKTSILAAMPPWQGGGAMIEDVDIYTQSTFADIPTRFEAGTPHVEGILGLQTAINFINDIGFDAIQAHEQQLVNYAVEQLNTIEHLHIYGTGQRAGVISFNFGKLHAFDVGSFLDKYGVAIRTGHHCALPLMKHFKVPSMCRASFAIYTNVADVDALISGLKRIGMLLESEIA